jgi:poly(A) polymerase
MLVIEKKLHISSRYFMTVIHCLVFAGGQARIVGGAVRDSLLGVASADVDIATDFIPEKVMNLLGKNGIKAIPTGIKFGTVTVVIEDEKFEITTLRKDIACNGRYALIQYSSDFFEDAARRDFTINALSYCPIEEKIYDYFGGIEHLKQRKLAFIGSAPDRIKEDYLRILRFFRFSARYAKQIDPVGLQACAELKDGINRLSKERIKSEMDGLLLGINAPKMLKILDENGILDNIFPVSKYDMSLHLEVVSACKKFNTIPSLPLSYAILFMYSENITLSTLIRLRFSKIESVIIIKLLRIIRLQKDDKNLLYSMKTIWLESKDIMQYFILAYIVAKDKKIIHELYLELSNMESATFPITGNDISSLGYKGKEIGDILDNLKKIWIESNFQQDKKSLLDMVIKNEK